VADQKRGVSKDLVQLGPDQSAAALVVRAMAVARAQILGHPLDGSTIPQKNGHLGIVGSGRAKVLPASLEAEEVVAALGHLTTTTPLMTTVHGRHPQP